MKKHGQIKKIDSKANRRNLEQFTTYDSRMAQVRRLTIKECEKVVIKLQDVYSYLSFSKLENHIIMSDKVEKLQAIVEKYMGDLQSGEIDLKKINVINKTLDKELRELGDFINEQKKNIADRLNEGVVAGIKKTGYYSLFNERKMKVFAGIYINSKSASENERCKTTIELRAARRAKYFPEEEKSLSAYAQSLGLYLPKFDEEDANF